MTGGPHFSSHMIFGVSDCGFGNSQGAWKEIQGLKKFANVSCL